MTQITCRRFSAARSFLAAAAVAAIGLFAPASSARADVYNVKVVTDASPDYTDMDSLVHSITSRWETDEQKMWALFYWNHIARRQTNPMFVNGKAETDPIRQFNDYGYTMCSTISGISCSIWQHMGYPVQYFDIALHTVPQVQYGGKWHHYDNSLSTYYTLCDGKTVASIEDIGKTLACPASGGKAEAGHIALYHCVHGTGVDGFLEGADTPRDLRHLGEDSFKPAYLKFRSYYNDAERGHRYILDLRDGEVYTRSYSRLDAPDSPGKGKEFTNDPAYFVPNGESASKPKKDPESKNPRYKIRGNGVRTYAPPLTEQALYRAKGVRATDGSIRPAAANETGEAVFKVEGANVITSLKISADLTKANPADVAALAVSTNNGMTWQDVYTAPAAGANKADVKLIEQVNGAYEVLVKAKLQATGKPDDVSLKNVKFDTVTQVNGKTQPKLNIGKNVVYVGAGEQTGSIVLFPELQADAYKPMAVESVNIKTKEQHEGWNGVMKVGDAAQEGYVVFKVDAPQDLTRITQTARMYVRNKMAEVRFEHSFDGGKTWAKSYAFNDNTAPWDDIHDQITTDIPAGTKSVLFKYILKDASLYSVRMEANHKVAASAQSPMEVTFNWSERQADYSLVERSHTQLVEKLPATYEINVGGADHPVVNSLTVSPKGARGTDVKPGYNDGKDAGGTKWVGTWATYGNNLALNKPYTVSVPPSENSWEANDASGKRLTDGRVGSSYSGGTSYREGALWAKGKNPEITVDLGEPKDTAAFRIHLHGYPGQDAIKGLVKDDVEVLTSLDGKEFTSAGKFDFRLRWKDIPVNYMFNDEETFSAHNHTLALEKPVKARYVKYKVMPSRMMVITEVQVLDGVKREPFDLKIALPKGAAVAAK